MRHVEVLLPDELNDFVETSIASGLYASRSDVVAEALRLLETQQSDAAKLKWLQDAVRIGIESGDVGEIDIDEIIAEGKARLAVSGG